MSGSTHDTTHPQEDHEHGAAAKPRPTQEELKARKARTRQRVAGDRETITVSMGPQHPSMHGVYQAVVDLDGEIVVRTRPGIGNLHRGVEAGRASHLSPVHTDYRPAGLSPASRTTATARRSRAWEWRFRPEQNIRTTHELCASRTTSCGWVCI
jgi:hypothetical protein